MLVSYITLKCFGSILGRPRDAHVCSVGALSRNPVAKRSHVDIAPRKPRQSSPEGEPPRAGVLPPRGLPRDAGGARHGRAGRGALRRGLPAGLLGPHRIPPRRDAIEGRGGSFLVVVFRLASPVMRPCDGCLLFPAGAGLSDRLWTH